MADRSKRSPGPAPGVVPLLRSIRSRRTFLPMPVRTDQLALLLEAARWAPSTWNAQPWRFVVVRREQRSAFAGVLEGLSDSNRRWAAHAPVLLVVAAWPYLADGRTNRHAAHDVGIASAFLAVQAAAAGLHVQPMAGLDPLVVGAAVGVPGDLDVLTVLAVGCVGPGSAVPADVARREQERCARWPVGEIAFNGSWGQPFDPNAANGPTEASTAGDEPPPA